MDFLRKLGNRLHKQHFVVLTVVFYKEEGDDRWLAECKELGTASYGDTLEEARERIGEAIELNLNTLEEVNEYERVFKEKNIKMFPIKPKEAEIEIDIKTSLNQNVFYQTYVHQLAGVC